jgi:ATP-dependent helicase/nuclease subunit A
LEQLARLEPLDAPPAPSAIADEVTRRLTARYPFERITKVAAAVPMTEAGGRKGATALAKSPLLAGVAPPGADEVGTATHRVLQHLDFRRADTREAIAAQVSEGVERRLLSPAEAARVDLDALVWLMSSEVGRLLRDQASTLRRELPVYAAAPAGADAGADQVMLRGRIDVLVPLADRSIVIDYKTDDVNADQVPGRIEFYRPQVDAYAGAIATITGKPVQVMLVFLRPRVVRVVP